MRRRATGLELLAADVTGYMMTAARTHLEDAPVQMFMQQALFTLMVALGGLEKGNRPPLQAGEYEDEDVHAGALIGVGAESGSGSQC